MKKKSVLYTWTLELALMLTLAVAMCVAMTGVARSRLLNEYEQFTAAQQAKIEDALDSYFKQLRVQAVELLGDDNAEYFAYLSVPETADNYRLYLVQNRLKSAMNAGLAQHLYIYFQNIQYAISEETALTPADCARRFYGGAEVEQQQLTDLMGKTALNRLVVTNVQDKPVILILSSIPSVGRWPRAMIIQQVSPIRLQSILESQSSLERATSLILDDSYQMVCYTGDKQLAAQLSAGYRADNTSNHIEVNGDKYWLYQKQVESTGWTVVTAAPMEIIASRSDWVWQMTAVFMTALILVWVLASFTIIRWNYKPLKALTNRADFGADASGNEYDQIDHAFRAVQNDLENLKRMQKKQREALLYEWLGNSVAYDIPMYGPVEDVLRTSMSMQAENAFAMLVLLRGGESIEAMQYLPEAEGCKTVFMLPRGRSVLCLLSADETALKAFSQDVGRSLEQNGVEYLMGEVRQGFTGLHDEFLALCEKSDRAGFAAAGSIRLSLASGDEILQLLFDGKGEEACHLLERSADANLAGQPMSAQLARMYYNNFLLHLLNEVPEGAVCSEVQHAIVSSTRALQNAASRQDMRELIETLLMAIADKYTRQTDEAKPDLLESCITCVREHFREHDFNVSRMADLLGVSVPYLSKYFKEHAGVNLLGYLNSVRIDYAKKLIAEEKLTVAAAADRAGFENINTFIRLFKKYVGDTPGNYSKQ